jgi:hypothetical protein
MKSFTIATILSRMSHPFPICLLTLTIISVALVAYAVPPFDPAGAKNVGNGAGGQFIGGQW